MNVPLAYQLFSKNIQVAMATYKNATPELSDCDPTVVFIKRVNDLIEAMSSRTPLNALRLNDNCPRKKVISDFIDYLKIWEAKANEERELYKKKKKGKKQKSKNENEVDDKFFSQLLLVLLLD
ncbi:uncharacterized protein LOC141536054 isoform X5 [Cotesia typhae]|uniref:uncharacterized protein LOC141536054 isoform X5 n=1 Tax=Cotesia typhae TaxID=2053667 RepID=UPI003D69C50F